MGLFACLVGKLVVREHMLLLCVTGHRHARVCYRWNHFFILSLIRLATHRESWLDLRWKEYDLILEFELIVQSAAQKESFRLL